MQHLHIVFLHKAGAMCLLKARVVERSFPLQRLEISFCKLHFVEVGCAALVRKVHLLRSALSLLLNILMSFTALEEKQSFAIIQI